MTMKIAGLADIVRRHARERPDATAMVYQGRVTSYGLLDRLASRVANGLIAEGIRPQVRVAHLDKSSDSFFELLFGVAKAGAVMVSVNWRLAAPEILHIVNDAEAEVLFVGEEYFPVIESIRDRFTRVRKIVSLGGRHADRAEPDGDPLREWAQQKKYSERILVAADCFPSNHFLLTRLQDRFGFTLDTVAPAAPGVSLANDTGSSASDLVTKDGSLALAGIESGATVGYSIDGGLTWSPITDLRYDTGEQFWSPATFARGGNISTSPRGIG